MKIRALRSPLHIMRASVTALVIRDIQKRFILSANTKRGVGFLWLFIEPLLHVVLWGGVRLFYNISSTGLPDPIFILLGVIPFLMAKHALSTSSNLFLTNRNLFIFRQILPFDAVLASVLSELLILIVITIVVFTLFYWFGISFHIYQPLKVIIFSSLYVCCIFSTMLLFAIAGFFIRVFQRLTIFFMRGLFFVSGVFFPVESIPEDLRYYFLLNPLFQVVQSFRESFMKIGSYQTYSDLNYMIEFAFISLFISLFMYTILRYRIMLRINEC